MAGKPSPPPAADYNQSAQRSPDVAGAKSGASRFARSMRPAYELDDLVELADHAFGDIRDNFGSMPLLILPTRRTNIGGYLRWVLGKEELSGKPRTRKNRAERL